jgi:hypothetical protein
MPTQLLQPLYGTLAGFISSPHECAMDSGSDGLDKPASIVVISRHWISVPGTRNF